MRLAAALSAPLGSLAFVGSGGKTTALFTLARQLPPPVWVTTTTHLGVAQLAAADQHWVGLPSDHAAPLEGVVAITGEATADGRVGALSPSELEKLHALSQQRQVPLLLEADGARRLPLKAPADHEPALPEWVETVVVTAGLSGLGRPLTSDWVHRPERFAALAGLSPGQPVTPEALVRVLLHPDGGLKRIPASARRVCLLNQADDPRLQSVALRMAEALLAQYSLILTAALGGSPGSQPLVFAAHQPAALIVLAAGAATRYGQAKQVLDWDGQPLVRRVAQAALAAQRGLPPIVVVGAYAEQVEAALQGLPVLIAHCANWQEGQSASLRAGLQMALQAASPGAAIFLLADQPHVPPTLLRALLDRHAQTLSPVIAPQVDGRRGTPVLFDRAAFADLLALRGDMGGRALFSRYPAAWLPWHDPAILSDIDQPQDYERQKSLWSLSV